MQDVTPDPPQLSLPFDFASPQSDPDALRRAKRAAYMRSYLTKNNERIN